MFIPIAALLLPTALSFSTKPLSSSSDSGLVSVSVQRCLPVSPKRARDAWVAYTFQQGGGQPALVLQKDPNTRLLVPLFAEETIIQDEKEATDQCQVEYTVSSLGPIWKMDITEGSHVGIVTFDDTINEDECSMTWTSSYTALHRRGFWAAVTRFLISNVSEHLASYLATPQLYTRQTNFISNNKVTPKMALEAWVDFTFLHGGGLPINPPFVLNSGNEEGEKAEMLRIPPLFLREQITSIHSVDEEECWLEYKVVNPGLFTYPVYTHVGRVRFFAQEERVVQMDWQVEIRPMRGLEAISKAFAETVVTTLARNLKSHLQEPNRSVPVYPPRGGSGGEPILRVPKDSWLGGVLAAHLSDGRSTWEQTIAMLQPWTWGRSTDEKGESAKWTEGFIE